MFKIRMGIPEMKQIWENLEKKYNSNTLSKTETELFKKLINCFKKLSNDSHYPGLQSHEIESLTRRYKIKVWESYLENNKPAAGRIFWVYGPNRGDITIIGLELHPNDRKNAYNKITLSSIEK